MGSTKALASLLTGLAGALLGAGLVPSPTLAAGDEYEPHYQAAQDALLRERFEDALREYQAAFALRPGPRILLSIAKVQLKLGQADAASASYARFLKQYPNSNPDELAKAHDGLAQARALSGGPAPPPLPKPTAPPPRPAAAARGGKAPPPLAPLVPLGEIHAMAGSGPNDIFAVGAGIHHFDGRSWSVSYSGLKLDLSNLFDAGQGRLWAVTNTSDVLYYDGQLWHRMQTGASQRVVAAWGAGPTDANILDAAGTVLRLDGADWFEVPTQRPFDLELWRAFVLRGNSVWAVGGSRVVHWDGSKLKTLVTGTDKRLDAVWAGSDDNVYVSGEEMTLLRFDGARFSPLPRLSDQYRTLPGLFGFRSPSGSQTLWITGSNTRGGQGLIARSQANEYKLMVDPTEAGLFAVWASDSQHAVAVGNSGTCLMFDGKSWSELQLDSQHSLQALWGRSPEDLWAVGRDGLIAHYDGKSWSTASSQTSDLLHAIVRIADRDLWAVGNSGTILHYDGTRWSRSASNTQAHLYALWASGPQSLWAAGEKGVICHYDGRLWGCARIPADRQLTALWGSSDQDIYAMSSKQLWHYDGRKWSLGREGTEFVSLWGKKASDVWLGTPTNLQHFDGQAWQDVPISPTLPPRKEGRLYLPAADGELHVLAGAQQVPDTVLRTDKKRMLGQPLPESPNTLFSDGSGRIWIGSQEGVRPLEREQLQPLAEHADAGKAKPKKGR